MTAPEWPWGDWGPGVTLGSVVESGEKATDRARFFLPPGLGPPWVGVRVWRDPWPPGDGRRKSCFNVKSRFLAFFDPRGAGPPGRTGSKLVPDLA